MSRLLVSDGRMWILICLSLNIETDSTRDTLTTATAAGVDGHVWKHGGGGEGLKDSYTSTRNQSNDSSNQWHTLNSDSGHAIIRGCP